MPTSFLKYWLYKTVKNEIASSHQILDHSASSQYRRAEAGDTVWFVTMPSKTKKLLLFGHMIIGRITNQQDAARLLGLHFDEIWEADLHALATPNVAEPYELIDITGIAADLRFETLDGMNRLPEKNIAQSLQTMRVLTPESDFLLRDIWYEGKSIPSATDATISDVEADMDLFPEGKRRFQEHYRRERNITLVAKAKRAFKKKHGRLYCEVCGFDFAGIYGDIGDGFIEAHHRQPLAELDAEEVKSSIRDLAMVCANCHRMLHRSKPWLSVEELRSVIKRSSQI